MSLYGALFSGVSGLSSESSAMGAIADNISNVNTVGYKGTDVNFNTLVTQQVSVTQYSPGGVQSAPRAAVDVQGLLQATSSSTDLAISGQGFFIVNSVAKPSSGGGEFAYTRAGSFIPNQNGYLQNASGFYLQGWPLTPTNNLPAAKPSEENINGTVYMTAYKNPDGTVHYINQNIVSDTELQSFNVNTIGGTAQATSNISMGANLPSGDLNGAQHVSNVLVYDSLGDSTNAQFTFTKVAANSWSMGVTPPSGAAVATLYNTTTTGANGQPLALTYASAGQLEFNNLPPANSYFQISSGTPSATNPVVQIQFFNSASGGTDPTTDTPATVNGVNFVSILGVDLNGVSGTSQLTAKIASTIQNAANNPYSIATNPTPPPGGGPTLNISSVLLGGLADGASRFSSNNTNVLNITQEPGAQPITINCADNATTGLNGSIVQSGTNTGSGTFGGTQGVFTVGSIWSGGSVTQPASYSQLVAGTKSFTITAQPPTGFFQVGNFAINWGDISAGTNPIPIYDVTPGSPPTFTVDPTINGGAGVTLTTGVPFPGSGDQDQLAQNLQTILPQLGSSVPAFAGLSVSTISGTSGSGNPAVVTLSSTGTAAPVYIDNTGAGGETTWSDGTDGDTAELLGPTGAYTAAATGLNFNGDGTPSLGTNVGLSTAIPGIVPTSMSVQWANGAENQTGSVANEPLQPTISLNLGSANETNGMTQLGGQYTLTFLQQNGAKFGNFSGLSIGSNGVVTALFDNGVRTPVFQIPLATFPNPDGMSSQTGNVFISTTTSGAYTVRQAGTGGSGTVAQASLEASTVDLGTQFTTMITVQRAYSAAAKVITTTDSMLNDLINIIPQ